MMITVIRLWKKFWLANQLKKLSGTGPVTCQVVVEEEEEKEEEN